MLLAILLVAPACNRNNPSSTTAAPEDRNATANANVTDQMKRDRDDYVTTTNAKLAEFDQKVDGLDERTAAMKGQAKDRFKDAISKLRDQRKTVANKLDDLKSVNVESWQTLRGEVDSAMADLNRSYEDVSNTYEKTPGTGRKSY
jgi:uncharacterized protein YukE